MYKTSDEMELFLISKIYFFFFTYEKGNNFCFEILKHVLNYFIFLSKLKKCKQLKLEKRQKKKMLKAYVMLKKIP